MSVKINVIDPRVNIITPLTQERCDEIMMIVERAGRVCYQSEPKGDPQSFITGIVKRGHESVIEHQSITVEFITDRGVTHELVRHRLSAFSQESTRYVEYSDGVDYIRPLEFLDSSRQKAALYMEWYRSCVESTDTYKKLREASAQKQEARSVLNNSLKTAIVMTCNLREWRHVFKMRCAKPAHPHIKQIMIPLLLYFQKKLPGIFDDIQYDVDFYNEYEDRMAEIVEEFVTPKKEKEPESKINMKAVKSVLKESQQESPWYIDQQKKKESPTEETKPKEELNRSYIAQLKLKGSYVYTSVGGSIVLKELINCTTSFRLQSFIGSMPTTDSTVYSEVREVVHMTTAIVVKESEPLSTVFKHAKDNFREMLKEHDRYDLIPYLENLTLGS